MNKLKSRIVELLRQGVRPEQIALTLALGLTLGTIPILGTTTLLCSSSALALRLNVPLILAVNYCAYPFQLLFYIPLLLLGASLLDASLPPLTVTGVYVMIKSDLWGSIQMLFWANLGAVLIWGSIAAPVGFLLYTVTRPLITRFHPSGESPQ